MIKPVHELKMGDAVGNANRTLYVCISDAMPGPGGTVQATLVHNDPDRQPGEEPRVEQRTWLRADAPVSIAEPKEIKRCEDCQRDISPTKSNGAPVDGEWEWFMVHNELWEQAGMTQEDGQFLCVGCLETRIDRRLVPEDFTEAPVNSFSPVTSERLLARLGPLAAEHR